MNIPASNHLHSQKGATLIVALVILLVMTIIGVSNMKSSSMQTAMSRYSENREQAFTLAESALQTEEARLRDERHDVDLVQDCSTGDNACFDVECTGGFCFNGTYAASDDPWDCELDLTQPPTYEAYWKDQTLDVWDQATRHRTGSNVGFPGFDEPKLIVEFLCYASADFDAGQECTSVSGNPDYCIALYRVTSYAQSRDQKARVMLQSITRVENL